MTSTRDHEQSLSDSSSPEPSDATHPSQEPSPDPDREIDLAWVESRRPRWSRNLQRELTHLMFEHSIFCFRRSRRDDRHKMVLIQEKLQRYINRDGWVARHERLLERKIQLKMDRIRAPMLAHPVRQRQASTPPPPNPPKLPFLDFLHYRFRSADPRHYSEWQREVSYPWVCQFLAVPEQLQTTALTSLVTRSGFALGCIISSLGRWLTLPHPTLSRQTVAPSLDDFPESWISTFEEFSNLDRLLALSQLTFYSSATLKCMQESIRDWCVAISPTTQPSQE